MKLRCLLFLLIAPLIIVEASACLLPVETEIILTGNDIPFKGPDGSGIGSRSIPMAIPFSAFLNEDRSINWDFYQALGKIEIVISQNGIVVYSSTESIDAPTLKRIPLQERLSGEFLLEVKGGNGAYVFGYFEL